MTDLDDWVVRMAEEPRLLKRPMLMEGQALVVGFDSEAWLALLEQKAKPV